MRFFVLALCFLAVSAVSISAASDDGHSGDLTPDTAAQAASAFACSFQGHSGVCEVSDCNDGVQVKGLCGGGANYKCCVGWTGPTDSLRGNSKVTKIFGKVNTAAPAAPAKKPTAPVKKAPTPVKKTTPAAPKAKCSYAGKAGQCETGYCFNGLQVTGLCNGAASVRCCIPWSGAVPSSIKKDKKVRSIFGKLNALAPSTPAKPVKKPVKATPAAPAPAAPAAPATPAPEAAAPAAPEAPATPEAPEHNDDNDHAEEEVVSPDHNDEKDKTGLEHLEAVRDKVDQVVDDKVRKMQEAHDKQVLQYEVDRKNRLAPKPAGPSVLDRLKAKVKAGVDATKEAVHNGVENVKEFNQNVRDNIHDKVQTVRDVNHAVAAGVITGVKTTVDTFTHDKEQEAMAKESFRGPAKGKSSLNTLKKIDGAVDNVIDDKVRRMQQEHDKQVLQYEADRQRRRNQPSLFSRMWGKVKQGVQATKDGVKRVNENVKNSVKQGVQNVRDFNQGVRDNIHDKVQNVRDISHSVKTGILVGAKTTVDTFTHDKEQEAMAKESFRGDAHTQLENANN